MLRAIHTNKLERMYVKKNGEIGIKNKRSWRTDARVRPVQNILNFKYFKVTRGIVLSEFSRD